MTFNLRIVNSNLVASQLPLLEEQEVAHLTIDKAAGSTTLTVDNISGFSIGKYVLLGNFGESNAEIIRVHTATAPSGSTITLNSATLFDHYTDTPVTVIEYNQVEFSRATTLAGAKTVLATNAISADRTDTAYTDLVNTTGYGFYRFKNSSTALFSTYSGGVSYTGNSYKTYESVALNACDDAAVKFGDANFATEVQLLNDVNEAQDVVSQMANWSFELIKDDTSIVTTVNENTYNLSLLTYTPKFPDTYNGILSVRFGAMPLNYVSIDEMEEILRFSARATLTATANVADITLTVDDSTEFADSGTVFVGPNVVTYTANNRTTGVLSGIAITDIVTAVAIGGTVWQNITPGVPTRYAIFRGQLILDVPVITQDAGVRLKIKYLKLLNRITDFSSTLEVPFYNAIASYITGKIELRKRNREASKERMQDFNDIVKTNFNIYRLPSMEEQTYYEFSTIDDAWPNNSRVNIL